jgi:hypothetical protein
MEANLRFILDLESTTEELAEKSAQHFATLSKIKERIQTAEVELEG